MRHQDAIYERWCATILRETRDQASLSAVAARALADRDVRTDPALIAAIQSFIEVRRAELRSKEAMADGGSRRPAVTSYSEIAATSSRPSPQQAVVLFQKLAAQYRHYLEHFDEQDAHKTLEQIRQLAAEEPKLTTDAKLNELAAEGQRHDERRGDLERQVREAARRAIEAASAGRRDEAADQLRRLNSVRAAYPALLSQTKLDEIRQELLKAAEEREHQDAARELIAKERRIAEEIEGISQAIRRFRRVAHTVPHDRDEFRDAESAYLRAIREVRSHDAEWFACVVLELCDLLSAGPQPHAEAQRQVNQFLQRIRTSISELYREIKETDTQPRSSSAHGQD